METKQKKKRRGLKLFIALTLLQWGALYGVNVFLSPESVSVTAIAEKLTQETEPPIQAPTDAEQFRISEDKKLVAYTKGKDLFIDNKDGNMYQKKVGRVTYMQWLGKSNSLLYFVQDSSLTGYIIQATTLKPHQVESWKGTDRQIKQAYFNPYMEFLYMETQRGKTDEIYKYDAVNGIYKFPLPDMKIDRIEFDDKADVMEIDDSLGKRWEYKNGHLYDPKGNIIELKKIKDATPTDDSKKDESKTDKQQTDKPTDAVKPGAGTAETPSTKEPNKQSTSKTTDQQQQTSKDAVVTPTTPTAPTKKDSTSGGIEPPTVNQTPAEGTQTPAPTKQQQSTKDTSTTKTTTN